VVHMFYSGVQGSPWCICFTVAYRGHRGAYVLQWHTGVIVVHMFLQWHTGQASYLSARVVGYTAVHQLIHRVACSTGEGL